MFFCFNIATVLPPTLAVLTPTLPLFPVEEEEEEEKEEEEEAVLVDDGFNMATVLPPVTVVLVEVVALVAATAAAFALPVLALVPLFGFSGAEPGFVDIFLQVDNFRNEILRASFELISTHIHHIRLSGRQTTLS